MENGSNGPPTAILVLDLLSVATTLEPGLKEIHVPSLPIERLHRVLEPAEISELGQHTGPLF